MNAKKKLKKLIVPLLFMIFLTLLFKKYGGELWVPGSVKKVRSSPFETLKKDAEDNISDYRFQLESAEKTAASYEKLGKKYAEQGNWTPAIDALSKAIEYGSSGPEVHYYAGLAYANRAKETGKKNDTDLSEAHYKKALEKNPGMAAAKYGLGLLTFYLKNDRQSGTSIMRALVAEQPLFYEAKFALGRFYYETGQSAAALSVYEDLYGELQKNADSKSKYNKEMLDNCQENISRIVSELSVR